MGLFSTLTSPSEKSEIETTSTSSKSLELPTVIQLYTDKPLPLTLDTSKQPGAAISNVSVPPSYAALHYTAVQCQTAAQLASFAASEQQRGLRSTRLRATLLTPDLGVWNCRVPSAQAAAAKENSNDNKPTSNSSESLSDSLLSIISSAAGKTSTFCMVVDLGKLETVEPSITRMQEALVRFLISSSQSSEQQSTESLNTTSLYQLQTVQFGLGVNDEKSASAMTKQEPDPEARNVKIALQICVKLPPNTKVSLEYKDQQAVALLLYHLRRYAAALSASLLFVSGASEEATGNKSMKDSVSDLGISPSKSGDNTEQPQFALLQEQPTVPVQQLPIVWRELAMGKQVWKPEESPEIYEDLGIDLPKAAADTAEEAGADTKPEGENVSAHSLIYGPGNHNEELIETVLLRNAHYPGNWDASKESVWNILQQDDGQVQNSPTTTATGDDWWLSELRESIAIPDSLKTPPPKKAGDGAASTVKQTPNDAAVSSFFEDLLK